MVDLNKIAAQALENVENKEIKKQYEWYNLRPILGNAN